ncbi:MAG TPA: tRNA preQ1(34) S-adenosylmethionine ribosyltransferase-isomerase QueA [Pyrinomonadaceae bacterium]|nr:tRNA preQ1(34) S-adenosylmethionine ribosyltransferase-isomerase QueA [Pyrinomonadaceae bacterium]
MLISEFNFDLPENLIAQEPLEKRESSRMLVVNRAGNNFSDENFFNLPKFLKKGDVVVLNNTKVFPARIYGETETGAKVEIFLVREVENDVWETLARPAKRLKIGRKIVFNENLSAEIFEKSDDGKVFIKFETNGDFDAILDEIGKTPLPPYIKREKDSIDKDRERYQTVFAQKRGAIAAPTAGLHFTPEILEEIKSNGVEVAEITLHVGYGTFEPVRVEDLSEHKVLPERYEILPETAEIINKAKSESRRVIAIGTTTTRTLESARGENYKIKAGKNSANLTITPDYKFKIIDGLLTNFHLPQSSLLVLTSTFGGHELIMKAYNHAVSENYRFYSYGDCMFIC